MILIFYEVIWNRQKLINLLKLHKKLKLRNKKRLVEQQHRV